MRVDLEVFKLVVRELEGWEKLVNVPLGQAVLYGMGNSLDAGTDDGLTFQL